MSEPKIGTEDPKPFGLIVEYVDRDWDDEQKPGWHVHLPHQCDSWDIAGEWSYPAPRAEAIAELERFIAEAQAALDKLRAASEEENLSA